MRFFSAFLFMALFSTTLNAQSTRIGLFGGISNYQGDLANKMVSFRFTKPAIGLTITRDINERISVRAGFTKATISSADSVMKDLELKQRNLSFTSPINEFHLVGIYHFFNEDIRISPYVFGGLAAFRFDPYTSDSAGTKVYLQPLGTEGQGLPGYRKQYARTQLAIPFGAGMRFSATPRINMGLELGFRKTFTDYLDDVSSDYADEQDLLSGRGPLAVAISYRGDEVPGGSTNYPDKDTQRGRKDQKDFYYFLGLHVNLLLGRSAGSGGSRKGFGCPKVTP